MCRSVNFLCLIPDDLKKHHLVLPCRMIMTCAVELLTCHKYTTMRHITAAEVSDLNRTFVEMLCLTVSENHVAIINCHCSHVTIT